MIMVLQTSISLPCSPNPLYSSTQNSHFSPQISTPFHTQIQNQCPVSKPSFSLTPLTFKKYSQAPLNGHRIRVPPLYSTAVEEIVETIDEHLGYVEIGYVSDVHGLQGEIRVKYTTDFPELRFGKPGKRWLRQRLSGKQKVLEVELERGRGHPGDKSWIVKLSGFDDIDQAKQLVGSTFLVRESDRPELEEGEFYSRDLVGMRVILKDTGEALGTVVNIFNSGANDLLHVMLDPSTESSTEGGKQNSDVSESSQLVWIPFVEAIVPDVDLDRREMHITPPKGLLQLNIRSDERSKKERRLSEWRERKKFQRRLIAAKKKLCELEQQHIFHGFRYGEKSQHSLLAEQIVSVKSSLLQQALQSIEAPVHGSSAKDTVDILTGRSGNSLKIPEKDLTRVGEEKIDAYSKHRENGLHLFSEGKVATILVFNNGKPEGISETGLVDSEHGENSTITLLEALLSNTQRFTEERAAVPLICISPAHEVQPLEDLFSSHDYFGFNSEKVRFLEEEKLPAVSCSAVEQKKNKVLMKSPWEILQSPVGSGGVISALSSNNIVEYLIGSGVEYVELCSVNERCLCGNPVFLGFVDSNKADIGILTFEGKKDFEDNFHVVLPMRSMKKLVKQIEKPKFQAIMKSNSHVELINKEWVDVIPSTLNSYEFRCSIDSLLNACSLDKSCLMQVTE